ncbi:hypothetical protein BG003_007688 [Podila horticola]|nr:hypothetical protein BG003_007688 [Podila horticola]
MTTTSVFDIHLLLESICRSLSPRDLRQCVLVSHTWNSTFSPFLWRIVRLHDISFCERFQEEETQAALARYSDNIQLLQVDTPDMLGAFSIHTMHHLTILKIDSLENPSSLFVDLIRQSSSLQDLEMAYFSNDGPPCVIDRFLSVLRAHRRLKSIKVYDDGSISVAMARRLLLSCGNLDTVFLEVFSQRSHESVVTPEAWLSDLRELIGSESPTFKVRNLTFDGDVDSGGPYVGFLKWCPNVERFAVPSTYDLPECVKGMASTIGSTMKKLQHLDLGLTDLSGYWAQMLIDECTGLKTFSNAYNQYDPHLTMDALLRKHQNTLTEVDLSANRLVWTAAGVLQDFLCACPNLCSFVAMGPYDQRHRLPHSGYRVPEKQRTMEGTVRQHASLWTCPNLKVLKLCFKSRRWDTTEAGGGERKIEYVPESLMSQLGQLSKLEDIWLARVEVVRDGAEFTFRDMTAEQIQTSREQTSRLLSVLSTLSALRRVAILGLKQVIDSGELDDVKKQHWRHVTSVESW